MPPAHHALQQLGWLIAWTFLFGLAGIPVVVILRTVSRRAKRAMSFAAHGCFVLVAVAPVLLTLFVVQPKWTEQSPGGVIGVTPSEDSNVPLLTKPDPITLATFEQPEVSDADHTRVAHSTPAVDAVPTATRLVGWIPIVWLCGAFLTGCILFLGIAGTVRLRFGTQALPLEAQRVVDSLLDQLQATRLQVMISDLVSTPVLVGIVRPVVLLPATAVGWSSDTLQFIVLHEIAHARRWDNLINLIQRVVEVLLFFQPAVWMASVWVREERELACDRFVTQVTRRPAEYARVLVSLATDKSTHNPVELVTCSSTRHALVKRVANLLGREETMKIQTRTIVCSVIACCMVSLACYQSFAADEPQSQSGQTKGDQLRLPAQSEQLKPTAGATKPDSKKVAPKQLPNRIETKRFTGQARLLDHIRVSATQAGVLSKVMEVGDRVEKGALVAALSNQRQRISYETLKHQLREPVDLQVAEKRFDLARKQLAAAKAKTQTYSPSELEVIVGEVDLAKLEVSRERSRLTQLKSQLQLAELALKATELRAPIAGRVTRIHKKAGEAVNAGDVVIEVSSRKRMKIEFRVPVDDVGQLRRGMQIEFAPTANLKLADERRMRTGTISSISDEVSVVNQVVSVMAIIDNSDESIRVDQIGRVKVKVPVAAGEGPPATTVTVKQRRTRQILGSARLSIDDVTGGQVLVTVRDRNDKKLIDEKSMKLGDACEFELDGSRYRLRISQLTNVLIGTDFAVFEIETPKSIEDQKNPEK